MARGARTLTEQAVCARLSSAPPGGDSICIIAGLSRTRQRLCGRSGRNINAYPFVSLLAMGTGTEANRLRSASTYAPGPFFRRFRQPGFLRLAGEVDFPREEGAVVVGVQHGALNVLHASLRRHPAVGLWLSKPSTQPSIPPVVVHSRHGSFLPYDLAAICRALTTRLVPACQGNALPPAAGPAVRGSAPRARETRDVASETYENWPGPAATSTWPSSANPARDSQPGAA